MDNKILCEFYNTPNICSMTWVDMDCPCLGNQLHCDRLMVEEKENNK